MTRDQQGKFRFKRISSAAPSELDRVEREIVATEEEIDELVCQL